MKHLDYLDRFKMTKNNATIKPLNYLDHTHTLTPTHTHIDTSTLVT